MLHYNSYRKYIKTRFGKPVLKIPINGGFSCPNRDGTKSGAGCIFCDNTSFSPAAVSSNSPLEQLISAKSKASSRFSAYLPYLQPFTNTYGTVDTLRSVYEPLISVDGVVGLAIGTRPDCFTGPIMDYLEELAQRTYLCMEIGLQSSHDSTLQLVNRGHSFHDFSQSVMSLWRAKIQTVVHIMLGLPGETTEMMLETARRIADLPVSGVKIHQLMIIGGTVLESWYKRGMVEPLSLQSYTDLLCKFLSFLNPGQHIHRLMADSRPQLGLIAPLWSARKTESLAFFHEYMEKYNVVQGDDYLG